MPLCCCRADDDDIVEKGTNSNGNGHSSLRRCSPPALVPQQLPEVMVTLNVYSLITQNKRLRKIGMGLYHTGVVIYGIEWGYGESSESASASGLFGIFPGQASGTLYRTLFIGVTTHSPQQVDTILHRLENEWRSGDYHILNHNCNHFAQRFCDLLSTVQKLRVPKWCNRAACVASKIVPGRLASYVHRLIDDETPKAKPPNPSRRVSELPESVIPRNWYLHPTIAQSPRYGTQLQRVNGVLNDPGPSTSLNDVSSDGAVSPSVIDESETKERTRRDSTSQTFSEDPLPLQQHLRNTALPNSKQVGAPEVNDVVFLRESPMRSNGKLTKNKERHKHLQGKVAESLNLHAEKKFSTRTESTELDAESGTAKSSTSEVPGGVVESKSPLEARTTSDSVTEDTDCVSEERDGVFNERVQKTCVSAELNVGSVRSTEDMHPSLLTGTTAAGKAGLVSVTASESSVSSDHAQERTKDAQTIADELVARELHAGKQRLPPRGGSKAKMNLEEWPAEHHPSRMPPRLLSSTLRPGLVEESPHPTPLLRSMDSSTGPRCGVVDVVDALDLTGTPLPQPPPLENFTWCDDEMYSEPDAEDPMGEVPGFVEVCHSAVLSSPLYHSLPDTPRVSDAFLAASSSAWLDAEGPSSTTDEPTCSETKVERRGAELFNPLNQFYRKSNRRAASI